MDADPQQRTQLPIACTLGPDDGAERIAQWRLLTGRALTDRTEAPGLLTLRFRDVDGAGAQLKQLVEAERLCCGFLEWELRHDRDGWTLRISGDDDSVRMLSFETDGVRNA